MAGGGRREPGFDLGEVRIRQNDGSGLCGQAQVWRSAGRTGDNGGHLAMVQQPCESEGTALDSVPALCFRAEPINRVLHDLVAADAEPFSRFEGGRELARTNVGLLPVPRADAPGPLPALQVVPSME